MRQTHLVGGAPSKVHRLLLTEQAPVTFPPNSVILHSEVVVDSSSDEEVLQIWLAVPMVAEPDISSPNAKTSPKTIYTNTVIHEEEENAFAQEIENSVQAALDEYGTYDEEEDDEWY